jgi:CheY-like chemotaxis protein
MRIVDPAQLEPHRDVESVLTAAMPSYAMATLSPAMKDVDPFDSPGPAKIAALQTNLGSTMFVVYHEEQKLLELLAPVDAQLIQNLAEVVATLRIPATAIEWLHPDLPQAELLKHQLLPRRIVVVVEDNAVAQTLLLDLLQSNGYSVHLVSSVQELEQVIAAGDPDAILVDSGVPWVDLANINRLVVAQSKDIPVIVVGETDVSMDYDLLHCRPVKKPTKSNLLDALAAPYSTAN